MLRRLSAAWLASGFACVALNLSAALPAAELTPLTIPVEGKPRTALAYFPKQTPPAGHPLVFIFHGHGGNAQNAARGFDIQARWPEAICLCLQGVPTPTRIDPAGKAPGWQRVPGEQGDRDLKFFDALLAHVTKTHKIDMRRIYATGFSNGGFFTYVLWAARGDLLAAVAPCGCAAAFDVRTLKPKPCLQIMGKVDRIVQPPLQLQTMETVRQLNGCEQNGTLWNSGPRVVVTYYPSRSGTPFVSAIHTGGHVLPKSSGAWIVRFFKEQSRP